MSFNIKRHIYTSVISWCEGTPAVDQQTEVHTLQVDGLARTPGLTQALHLRILSHRMPLFVCCYKSSKFKHWLPPCRDTNSVVFLFFLCVCFVATQLLRYALGDPTMFILQATLNPPFFVCRALFVYRSLSTDSMSFLCKRRVYDFQGPGHCRKLSKLSALLCFHCNKIH